MPHALLDILRGCNVTCRACYNSRPPHCKTLEEIRADLDVLMAHRRLQSVSLVGGEVTMHPDLCRIVEMVRARGLFAELFSNGVLLDDRLLSRLKRAGADLICLHVEAGQQRPDLPANASAHEVRRLQSGLAERVAAHGLEVGLAETIFDDAWDEVAETVRFVIDSPHLTFLVATLHRDHGNIRSIRGSLCSKMRGDLNRAEDESQKGSRSNLDVARQLFDRLGLRPFAYLESNVDEQDPRWLSYLVAASRPAGAPLWHPLRAGACERAYLALSFAVRGRYPMYLPQRPARLAAQLLFNALAGGTLLGTLTFLARSLRSIPSLRAKRILFQEPATVEPGGRVVHCFNCPDAVAIGGHLVPACLADRSTGSDTSARCRPGGRAAS